MWAASFSHALALLCCGALCLRLCTSSKRALHRLLNSPQGCPEVLKIAAALPQKSVNTRLDTSIQKCSNELVCDTFADRRLRR